MSQASSRYAQSQNIAAAVCDAVLKKETSHRQSVKDHMGIVEAAAPRLRQDGGDARELCLYDTLMAMVRYIDDDSILSAKEVNDFLQEARDRLKGIAEMNVENDRNIDVFCQSVKALKQVEVANFDQAQDRTDEEMGDPGERLKEIYAQKKAEERGWKLEKIDGVDVKYGGYKTGYLVTDGTRRHRWAKLGDFVLNCIELNRDIDGFLTRWKQ